MFGKFLHALLRYSTLHSTNIPNVPYSLERFLTGKQHKQTAFVCFWKCYSIKWLENHSNNLINQFVQFVGPLATRLSQLNWFVLRGNLKLLIWKIPSVESRMSLGACHHQCTSRLVELFAHLGIVENHLGNKTTGGELQHSVLFAWPSSSKPTCFDSCQLKFSSSHGPHDLGSVSELQSILTKHPCPPVGNKFQLKFLTYYVLYISLYYIILIYYIISYFNSPTA
jgi:hypothetical protein